MSEIAPGWESSPEWGFPANTATIIRIGTVSSDASDPESIIYKINTVTSAAETAGKAYSYTTAVKGKRVVAIIVTEV